MSLQGARIRELSDDTAENFRDLRQIMDANFTEVKQSDKRLFEHVQLCFRQAHDFVQERFGEIGARLDRIEATMATKDDISRVEADITSIKATQEQILQLLQQKSGE